MAAVAILDFRNREYLFAVWLSGGISRITVPNFVKMVAPLRRHCDFSNFQDGRGWHLGFLRSRNFIGYCGSEGGDA